MPLLYIDVGEHFVKAAYFLQGDGPLLFFCCEKVKAVSKVYQVSHYPKVHADATAIARENPGQNVAALERRAKAFVEPEIMWFLTEEVHVYLYDVLVAFKAATLFCPVRLSF